MTSEALEGNPLGDASARPLTVYLPPGYDTGGRFPVIYLLQGYGGTVANWDQRPIFGHTVPERIDEVFAKGDVPACLVVYVDAWTSLGGSQFIDSPAVGRYQSYLCEDVVRFVDEQYRTLAAREHRALQGKSSGGFGAMVNAMLRPEVFGAFASHAGDGYFELCYLHEIAHAYRALRDHYERSYEQFLADFRQRAGLTRPDDFALAMVWAMSACFSSDTDGTVHVPFDPESGELRSDIWQRWLSWDPVRMIGEHGAALRSMAGIWLDAGRSDEFMLDVAAERMRTEMDGIGVRDIAFELFAGTHRGNEDRFPLAIRYLAGRVAPSQ